MHGRLSYVVGLAMALVLVGGVARASIPDSGGAIHACVRVDGSVVVKDDAGTGSISCGAQETQVKVAQYRPGTPHGLHIVRHAELVPPATPPGTVIFVGCPAGEQAISVNGWISDEPGEASGVRQGGLAANFVGDVDAGSRGYYVYVENPTAHDLQVLADVVCAKTTP